MSYQVLARKWRPRRFAELVGQEHVVRALTHALDSGRVHHALLFTGTRGVGKTTLARIFAKSLNCERGVGSDPCGECSACRDIDAGRFMDLLEIDAASNTGVDDVREVIENAQYRPARGQFKVYLVDEVHMLSKNAFNALLKTLEEPPEHAKFLLATTDPQKLPVTVLSRCLQFNLKRLTEEQIGAQLARIVAAEAVAHDADSLAELARAGNGSMRDALSLLDQAIAHGGGALRADEVRAMLGTIDRSRVDALLGAVIDGDGERLWQEIETVAEFAPDFATVLDELAGALHRVQLAQLVPSLASRATAESALTTRLHPEEVQLLYQFAVNGKRDLGAAPSPRAGFEMALLRMMAFRPAEAAGGAAPGGPSDRARSTAPGAAAAPTRTQTAARSPASPTARAASAPAEAARPASDGPTVGSRAADAAASASPPIHARPDLQGTPLDAERWAAIVDRLGLRGPLRELAHHAVIIEHVGDRLRLGLSRAHEHLRTDLAVQRLADALTAPLGGPVRLQVDLVDAAAGSIAAKTAKARDERQSQAEATAAADPFVHDALARFGGRIVPGSTRPLED